MSMTRYPDIRPVPETIPRPPYVPTNFFLDGWGDHLPGSDLKFDGKLGEEGEEGVRRAGKVVAELLKEVGRIIRVSAWPLSFRTDSGSHLYH
jgi:methionyl aminopeptidase